MSITPYLFPLLSVLIGYGVALFLKPEAKKNIKLLLAFSGAFLLSITVMHLLPEIYEVKNNEVPLFIMFGILFQIILEFFSILKKFINLEVSLVEVVSFSFEFGGGCEKLFFHFFNMVL